MGTAIMVTSGKGGTGKTSLTAGVSSCLAALGNRVLCIDMDIGLRNLDIALGMTDIAIMDFTDVIELRCPMMTAITEHPDIHGLFLLTAPITTTNINTEGFYQLVREARDYFDFIFLDSPAGFGDGFRLAMNTSDHVLVVSATDVAALRDAQRTVAELNSKGNDIHLIMNRVQPSMIRKLRTTIDDAMDMAGLPLLGVVPEDKNVTISAAQGIPFILFSHKRAAIAYLNIAKRILGNKVPLMSIR